MNKGEQNHWHITAGEHSLVVNDRGQLEYDEKTVIGLYFRDVLTSAGYNDEATYAVVSNYFSQQKISVG
ncbi:MAG: hypothetical protein ABIV51_09525, partial [Saprospiraceae bacterium]